MHVSDDSLSFSSIGSFVDSSDKRLADICDDTVNQPASRSKLIFLLGLCLLPTLDCCMYISKNSHTLNIYVNKYSHVCTIKKYIYNICYIKVSNEHIDLKRKVCVILILSLTIPCCEPTSHMCNNGLFIYFYHYYNSTAHAHNILLLCILHCTHLYQHVSICETLNQRLIIVIYGTIQHYIPT